jgi:hypothetical protein
MRVIGSLFYYRPGVPRWLHKALQALVLACLLPACYEEKEGCLDRQAVNFNLDADFGCGNCCEYPLLRVAFAHRWEGEAFALAPKVYTDGAGNPFRIKRIRYYWSALELLETGGQARRVTDSIDMRIVTPGGDTLWQTLPDNYLLGDPSNSQSRILGTFPFAGSYQRLQAVFGVDEPANRAVPISLPQRHPLAPQVEGQHISADQGYMFARIDYFPDTLATTAAVTVVVSGNARRQPLALDFPATFSLPNGYNALLQIEADYARWFEHIDVRADTAAVRQQLETNFSSAFRVVNFGRE